MKSISGEYKGFKLEILAPASHISSQNKSDLFKRKINSSFSHYLMQIADIQAFFDTFEFRRRLSDSYFQLRATVCIISHIKPMGKNENIPAVITLAATAIVNLQIKIGLLFTAAIIRIIMFLLYSFLS